MYDGERADARALDQLEAVLRTVAEELAAWRERALRAEAGRGGGGPGRGGGEARARLANLEAENGALRQRVEAARERVSGLIGRLTFLEEQAREQTGAGAGAGVGVGR